MQTMNALVRINGSRDMTVRVTMVTPGEAWLLMHIHDPETKEVFEEAVLGSDVSRTKLDERARLQAKYPEQAKLIEQLYPGRTAADVPERFDELNDVPLEVAVQGRRERIAQETEREVRDADLTDDDFPVAPAESLPVAPVSAVAARAKKLSSEESREVFAGKKR